MEYENHTLRHELKYYINYDTCYVLRQRLRQVISLDPHMPSEEGYLVSSLYFDDIRCSAAHEKINGSRFRKKFRIRSYGRSPETIRLECKGKLDEYIYKDMAELSREEYDSLLAGDCDFLLDRPEDVCRELFCRCRTQCLKPSVMVEYQREAFVYPLGDVRITFDKDIAASHGPMDMFSPECTTSRVLPDGVMVLEIKYGSFLPVHIMQLLKGMPCERCAISKYLMCRDRKRMVSYR